MDVEMVDGLAAHCSLVHADRKPVSLKRRNCLCGNGPYGFKKRSDGLPGQCGKIGCVVLRDHNRVAFRVRMNIEERKRRVVFINDMSGYFFADDAAK